MSSHESTTHNDMNFDQFPVKQNCDADIINGQDTQAADIVQEVPTDSNQASSAEVLLNKPVNSTHCKNGPPGLHDGPHVRVYHQNELLKIGAAFDAAGLRRVHSAREDLSRLSWLSEL